MSSLYTLPAELLGEISHHIESAHFCDIDISILNTKYSLDAYEVYMDRITRFRSQIDYNAYLESLIARKNGTTYVMNYNELLLHHTENFFMNTFPEDHVKNTKESIHHLAQVDIEKRTLGITQTLFNKKISNYASANDHAGTVLEMIERYNLVDAFRRDISNR